MLAAVKAVKRLIGGKDDAAGLQQQIAALKREGSEASEEIERLKRERALAASFEEAEETDRASTVPLRCRSSSCGSLRSGRPTKRRLWPGIKGSWSLCTRG